MMSLLPQHSHSRQGAAHIAPVFGLNMTLTAVHLMGNSMGTAGIDVLRDVRGCGWER